jgi:ribosome-binding protein aMBF1 (putative translation factor)
MIFQTDSILSRIGNKPIRKRETMTKEASPPLPCPEEQPLRKRALPRMSKNRVPESQPERELFARNVRAARIAAGLSQRELAQRTGIAQAHISQMENAMHNVCIDTMVRLTRELGVPLYDLFRL